MKSEFDDMTLVHQGIKLKRKRPYKSTARLTIGILLSVFSILLFLQANYSYNKTIFLGIYDNSALKGFISGILMLISGIVGACTSKKNNAISIGIPAALLLISAMLSIGTSEYFPDFLVWGIICLIASGFFNYCYHKTYKTTKKLKRITVVFYIIIAITIIYGFKDVL